MRNAGLLLILAMLFYLPGNTIGELIPDPSQLSPNPTIIDFEDINTAGNLVTRLSNPVIIGGVTFFSLTEDQTVILFGPSHRTIAPGGSGGRGFGRLSYPKVPSAIKSAS